MRRPTEAMAMIATIVAANPGKVRSSQPMADVMAFEPPGSRVDIRRLNMSTSTRRINFREGWRGYLFQGRE
jgi:hypothetical protein